MSTTRIVFVGAMIVAGLALALASLRWPVVNDGAIPPFMSLLGVSLLVDLVLMNRANAGQVAPLQMSERFIGFIAGGLVYLGTRWALAS